MTSLGDDSKLKFLIAKVGGTTGGGRHLPGKKRAVFRPIKISRQV
jgi:hypothetical protein